MYRSAQSRQRTRISFAISLSLHLLAIVATVISFPVWYKPPPVADPIVSEPIEVVSVRRFHFSNPLTQLSPPQPSSQRHQVRTATIAQTKPPMSPQQMEAIEKPGPLTAHLPSTAVALPPSDFGLSPEIRDKSDVRDTVGTPVAALIDPPEQKIDMKRGFSQKRQENTPTVPSNLDGEPSLSPDEQIGSALEQIAESVATGKGSSTVDVVFILDSSGSMADNIRAVGGQLVRMVDIFQENQIDFTLGVVTFKYLERDTMIFPQTQAYQKYQRLLLSHVVKRGGDERAYDAVVQSIAGVKFRPDVERRFILVTDEPCKGSYTTLEVLNRCRSAKIKVDVIGVNEILQKALASQTGGLWFPIPGG